MCILPQLKQKKSTRGGCGGGLHWRSESVPASPLASLSFRVCSALSGSTSDFSFILPPRCPCPEVKTLSQVSDRRTDIHMLLQRSALMSPQNCVALVLTRTRTVPMGQGSPHPSSFFLPPSTFQPTTSSPFGQIE